MKKILPLLIIALLGIGLGSCRRASDHGKLDGLWQIREIEYTDGSIVNPEIRMIAVQLELLQLQNAQPSPDLTGVLDYHKGASELGVDFRYNPTDDQLAYFGFAPDAALSGADNKYCVLQIEHLSKERLVLRSPIAVITCRKY